jgi:aspartyl-tRNA synthetase
MEKYGSDKPDLRFNLEMKKLNNIFEKTSFKVFQDQLNNKSLPADRAGNNYRSFSSGLWRLHAQPA